MHTITEQVKELFAEFSSDAVIAIDPLPQAGSERHYFRLHTAHKTYIATHGANLKENETFIYFSHHFQKKALATPEIYCVNQKKDIYIQEDFGSTSLIDKLESGGFTTAVY